MSIRTGSQAPRSPAPRAADDQPLAAQVGMASAQPGWPVVPQVPPMPLALYNRPLSGLTAVRSSVATVKRATLARSYHCGGAQVGQNGSMLKLFWSDRVEVGVRTTGGDWMASHWLPRLFDEAT